MSLLASVAAGAVIGAKHCFEADHIAAVSTLTRQDNRSPVYVGASWGVGHSAVVLTAGILFLLSGIKLPGAVATTFELSAALVLILLGIRTLLRLTDRNLGHVAGVEKHHHLDSAEHESDVRDQHTHLDLLGVKLGSSHTHIHGESFCVGILHGFAGSGAAVLLLATSTPDTLSGFGYLLSFSAATVLAMGFFAAVWGKVIKKQKIENYLLAAAGTASIAVGTLIILEVAGFTPGI